LRDVLKEYLSFLFILHNKYKTNNINKVATIISNIGIPYIVATLELIVELELIASVCILSLSVSNIQIFLCTLRIMFTYL